MGTNSLKKMDMVIPEAAKGTLAIPIRRGLMSSITCLFPIREFEHARSMNEEKHGSTQLDKLRNLLCYRYSVSLFCGKELDESGVCAQTTALEFFATLSRLTKNRRWRIATKERRRLALLS